MSYYSKVRDLHYIPCGNTGVVPAYDVENALEISREITVARVGFVGNAWGGAQWVGDYDGPFKEYNTALRVHQLAVDELKLSSFVVRKKKRKRKWLWEKEHPGRVYPFIY